MRRPAGGLADINVFDRSDGRQLPVYWHEGRAWAAGKPGNEYSVRIRNRGREDVLAVVSVDGVNAVTGETANPHQGGYVLSPWRQFELSGWRKNLSSTAAFYLQPAESQLSSRSAPAAASPPPLAATEAAPAMKQAQRRSDEATSKRAQLAGETPEKWLERIAELRRAGKHEEADRALAEFRKRHPDYRIPEAMLEHVERR